MNSNMLTIVLSKVYAQGKIVEQVPVGLSHQSKDIHL